MRAFGYEIWARMRASGIELVRSCDVVTAKRILACRANIETLVSVNC